MNKKRLFIVAGVLIAFVLAGAVYLQIWGGEAEIENFAEVRENYEILAQLALDTYGEISPEDEYVIFDIINDGTLQYDSSPLPLNEEQQKAVMLVCEEFNYLRVCEDAVFFCEDETGYYGLVYSKHPLVALYKERIPQRGRDYHRLSSHWYEWGVFGL